MRLATFEEPTSRNPTVGVIDGDLIYPFPQELSMMDVIAEGLENTRARADIARRGTAIALESVRLSAPLQPRSVRDFAAFEEHVIGARRGVQGVDGVPDAWYDAPTFYFTNPHTIYGANDVVPFPASSQLRDFELEVAVVVGKAGSSVSANKARDHIFGYLLFNDWSARDIQGREMQVGLGPAKGKDFGTTLGPWIVTADELEPFRNSEGFLELLGTASVNGTVVGQDLLSNMAWNFETLVAYASRDSRIEVGDVLGSGTFGNGGCLAELWGRNGEHDPPALREGDVVTIAVTGIGVITNTIGTAQAAPELPPVRHQDPQRARNAAQSTKEN